MARPCAFRDRPCRDLVHGYGIDHSRPRGTSPMTTRLRRTAMIAAGTLVAGTAAASGATADGGASASTGNAEEVHLKLTPSSPEVAKCLPRAKVRVEVRLTTDQIGFDF